MREIRTDKNKEHYLNIVDLEMDQLKRNGDVLEKFEAKLKKIGLNIEDSYELGSTLGRIVKESADMGSREMDFLFDLGRRILNSFGNEDFQKNAKEYFDNNFPIRYVLIKDGVKIGE